MIINLIVVLLILLIGLYFSKEYEENRNSLLVRKKYIQIISFILILQSGLRNVAVGSDTYSYYISFLQIKDKSWQNIFKNFVNVYANGIGKDPGYSLFEKVINVVTNEYQVLLFVIAILFFLALGNFILKNTSRLSDAVLAFVIYSVLFYSFFSITGHRQTIATAASLFAFEYIKKKKFIPFILLILIAATIHKSVLIFVPFYFIAHIKKSEQLNWIVITLFPLLMLSRNLISQYFKEMAGYEDYEVYEGAGTFTFTFLFLIITIMALLRSEEVFNKNNQAYFAYNAFALALLFIPLTWVNPSAMRVVQYFSIFMLLLIPNVIHSFNSFSKEKEFEIRIFTILILILLMIKSGWNADPYGFFWDTMKINKFNG